MFLTTNRPALPKVFFVALSMGLVSYGQSASQASLSSTPSFEVVSIKPSAPNEMFTMGIYPGIRFAGTAIRLRILIVFAYRIQDFQLEGPDWIEDEKFDVEAKAGPGATREDVPVMLQKMLADRFKLVVRKEEKQAQIYALILAKGGPRLQAASTDPAIKSGIRSVGTQMETKKATMAQLADALGRYLRAPVEDRTDIKGNFEFSLNWARSAGAAPEADGTDQDGLSLFGSLQQQLGLKLEARKGSSPTIVIEHVERPSSN